MLPQADRLALDFQIPAVFDRLLVQLAIRRLVSGAVFLATARDLLTRRLQLRDQQLETSADACQGRGAFFLQFLEKLFVLGPGFVDAHGIYSKWSGLPELDSLTTAANMPVTDIAGIIDTEKPTQGAVERCA
jgi:hypothetical protein